VARRAVVADCKAAPYGGALWEEYRRRLHALGDGCTSGPGFESLTPGQVEALRGSYGVTFACLAIEVVLVMKRSREAKT